MIKSRVRWAGHVACMGEINVYKILVEEPEKNKPVGRPRRRWEDNITRSSGKNISPTFPT
jgi:hypothetical protein